MFSLPGIFKILIWLKPLPTASGSPSFIHALSVDDGDVLFPTDGDYRQRLLPSPVSGDRYCSPVHLRLTIAIDGQPHPHRAFSSLSGLLNR
ncbi:hypothetical protein F0562_030447 [Nyssa sinensis]|uniref:Secreted protein n=1 Tax=Nyssa sinensis TaxID=561372 RepID=A0A5J5AYC7_9ASTE|nr:hypothetical protein F0562_030447 [Nyssa sinensis]